MNKGHLSALESRHAEIEHMLEAENGRPMPDSDLIHRLKKKKLHLKDEITQERTFA